MSKYEDLTELEGNTKIGIEIPDNTLYDLKDQIINLNNLGKNYLSNINIKENIDQISELFYYINEYYLSIPNIDQVLQDETLIQLTYRLLFVDMYNIILPNYLKLTNFSLYNDVESFIRLNYDSEKISNLKEHLLKTIKTLVQTVNSIKQLLTSTGLKETQSKELDVIINLFGYYAELIDSNDNLSLKSFIKNFLYRILKENINDLEWRFN